MAHIIACPPVASISPGRGNFTLSTMKTCLRGILELSQGIWKNQYKPTIIDGKSLQGWGGLSLSMESAVSEVPKTDSLEGKQHLIGGPETAAPPPSSD